MKPKSQIAEPLFKRTSRFTSERSKVRLEREFEPIYEIQEIYTDQIMLPYASNDPIQFLQRNNSDFLKDRDANLRSNLPPSDLVSPVNPNQFVADNNKKQANRHVNLTRQIFHEMNKKHRNIRTSHYKKRPNAAVSAPFEENLQSDNPILTARELRLSNQKIFTRKTIMTSYGQRVVNNIMRKSEQFPEKPKRAASIHQMRRDNNKITGSQKFRAFQLPKHNPLVIYPFQSKLKLKRIDENPKILGNIIRKKFKQLQKEQLYMYINGIVHRR